MRLQRRGPCHPRSAYPLYPLRLRLLRPSPGRCYCTRKTTDKRLPSRRVGVHRSTDEQRSWCVSRCADVRHKQREREIPAGHREPRALARFTTACGEFACCPVAMVQWRKTRQFNSSPRSAAAECTPRTCTGLIVELERACVFSHDRVGDRQAQASALATWFGREEGVQNLVPDGIWVTHAVVLRRGSASARRRRGSKC